MQNDGPTKSTHPLGHSVTHTDTAQGKGGGRLTEKAETGTPGAETAGQGDAENAKSSDQTDPGKSGLKGQDAQEIADRMGTGGKGMADKAR